MRFENTPDWVEVADISAASAEGEEIVIFDRQLRLEGGVVHRYTDVAYEIRNAEMLARLGTLQFGWLPDKGDLLIHRMEIIRDGKTVDLVRGGIGHEVIRRETELERRTVNGALTALFKVPGIKVGDTLRFASSTTSRDQALSGAMQATEGLTAEPARIGFGRLRISWPEDAGISFATLGTPTEPQVRDVDGYRLVEALLPIGKSDAMPGDAPGRFKVAPAIMVGTFDSWADVAAVMAPHYATRGTIQPGSALAAEVDRIRNASADPLVRASIALRTVQDDINYLMNGMDGGNYLPQAPAETWALRYGDCKAKTLLLLAILRELGIDAEAAMVNAGNGDAVSVWQPLPSAFDHVVVRAVIGGTAYWLDGTSAGSRLDTIGEVPDFGYALPVRAQGADLIPLDQRWPQVADRTYRITYDFSRGVDLPGTYEIEVETRGVMAARMASQASETDPRKVLGHAQKYLEDVVDSVVYEAAYSYDVEAGIARLKARGLVLDPFTVERGVAAHTIYTSTTNWSFDPDRGKAAWRAIPYRVGGPMMTSEDVAYILPERGKGAEVMGTGTLEERVIAGTRFRRELDFSGGRVAVKDWASYVPAEIAAEDIPAAKAAMRAMSSADPSIRITDPTRYWELDDAELARRMESVIVPTQKLVALLPGESAYHVFRSALFAMARDYKAALKEIDRAIELDGSAQGYSTRAEILTQAGRFAEAAEAARQAYELSGDLARGTTYAIALSNAGRDDDGLAVLDAIDVSGEDFSAVAQVFAEVAGTTGRSDEAWERLENALSERPGDDLLLNSQCWFIGTWRYRLDEGSQLCDRAVKASNYSANALDSRALVFHRLGRQDEALEDLQAALKKEPGQANSLYLRGIIRLGRGEPEGRADIQQALRLSPDIATRYERYGLSPKR